MRFEIVVAAHPSNTEATAPTPPISQGPGLQLLARAPHRHAGELLDVFIDGANVTVGVGETHGTFVLRDLALALVDLARRTRAKATVGFYEEPWEMCVERFGATACVSIYKTGVDPQVAVYDRAVPFDDIVTAVRAAMVHLLASGDGLPGAGLELAAAAELLRGVGSVSDQDGPGVPAPVLVVVEADRDAPLAFSSEFSMRAGDDGDHSASRRGGTRSRKGDEGALERADLHALLFRGRVRAEIRGHAVDLGDCHPLLVAERLVDLARRAFDASERGLGLHARGETAGVLLGVRVRTSGELALTLGASRSQKSAPGPRRVHTFPALGAADLLDAALAFGRSLVRAILRHDRAQMNNLRLGPLRQALRQATESLRDASQTDSKVNATPEPYRAYAAAVDGVRLQAPASLPASRLRYAPRWRAVVPGIDLRATYLCGDRLVVGSATEMWALDRTTGRVLWRTDALRGTSVVTPGGIARLASDGSLRVYGFETGEVTLRTRIAPRTGGPVAGAVVHLPGLPKLVIVTEGDHHLVAVDLTSGEPRWRWSWGKRCSPHGRNLATPRMKRAGRLAYFTCGDGALTALDVMSGAVVWRLRDRLRFRTPPTIVHDALFVVAGGAHGLARMYCVDPYSGRVRWSGRIGDESAPCTVQGGPIATSGAVAAALRHKSGLALAVFRREDGAPLAPPRTRVVAPIATSWLGVDDAFIGNTPTGELVAIDETSGDLRWRQVLGPCPLESDVPRRLEPVLRCGALFVPHTEVVVVRPHDGKVLGAISPTEAIPDLLRVDERCDVYVAEESGHLIAFGALPRLALVKNQP
jgi:outer membrane protein assembly factor BamB